MAAIEESNDIGVTMAASGENMAENLVSTAKAWRRGESENRKSAAK